MNMFAFSMHSGWPGKPLLIVVCYWRFVFLVTITKTCFMFVCIEGIFSWRWRKYSRNPVKEAIFMPVPVCFDDSKTRYVLLQKLSLHQFGAPWETVFGLAYLPIAKFHHICHFHLDCFLGIWTWDICENLPISHEYLEIMNWQ